MMRLLLLLVWPLVGGASCSLLIDFEEENRPCGPDEDPVDNLGDCLEGYTCMVATCVANHSVPVGETCVVNVHCVLGAVCTQPPPACRLSCQYPYGNGECSTRQACIPMIDASGNATAVCSDGEDCAQTPCAGSNDVCIEIKSGVGRCFESCQVGCSAAGCSGDCAADDACQPVGPDDVLACVTAGDGDHGDPCDLESLFCDSQHACMTLPDGSNGVCIQYCQNGVTSCDGLTDPSTGQAAECNLVAPIAGESFSICGRLPSDTSSDGDPQQDGAGGDPSGDSGSGSGD